MPDEVEKAFVDSFVQFLREKTKEPCGNDVVESLEVAIQCLEYAFESPGGRSSSASITGIAGGGGGGESGEPDQQSSQEQQQNQQTTNNDNNRYKGVNLFELFQTAFVNISPDRKKQAEEIKNEGNRLMKEGKYTEALNTYNRAITMDATNPVYYCNRAAAYIRLNEFEKAIADCKQALVYNSNYSKAHGRMGIAYSNMHKYDLARESYRKALELEPDNQDFQNNLRICEQRLENRGTVGGVTGGPSNLPGGLPNLGNLLQNFPSEGQDIRNWITDMLNDPMVSMMSRQLLSQLENQNPDFISGLRQQFSNLVAERNDGTNPATGGSPTGIGGGGAGTAANNNNASSSASTNQNDNSSFGNDPNNSSSNRENNDNNAGGGGNNSTSSDT